MYHLGKNVTVQIHLKREMFCKPELNGARRA